MESRMISVFFLAALVALCGLRAIADEPPGKVGRSSRDAKKPAQQAAKTGGPGLQGRIVDEAGQPLRGAKVILYAGIATRWKIAEAETGADGRYRFDSVESSMVKNPASGSMGPIRRGSSRASDPRRGGRPVVARPPDPRN